MKEKKQNKEKVRQEKIMDRIENIQPGMKKMLPIGIMIAAISIALTGCGGGSAVGVASNYEEAGSVAGSAGFLSTYDFDSDAGYSYDNSAVKSLDSVSNSDVDVMEAGRFAGAQPENTAAGLQADASQKKNRPSEKKKLIYTYSIDAETQDVSKVIPELEKSVQRYGGYIESSSLSGGNMSGMASYPSANYTVRIPAEDAEGFLSDFGGMAYITYKTQQAMDITASYLDIQAHRNSLEKEESRLLDILETASSVSDIIDIEDRLSSVRYQRESMESQLRSYDNQVDYSRITIRLSEVQKYTEPKDMSILDRITTGFMDNLEKVCSWLVDRFVWVVTHIPEICLWIAGILLIRKFFKARRAKRRKAKEAKMKMEYKAPKAEKEANSPEESKTAQKAENDLFPYPDTESDKNDDNA